MERLEIPNNSKSSVVKLLRAILISIASGKKYECKKKRNRGLKIKDNTPQANVIYHAMETDRGIDKNLRRY
jgi:hypothetical protein